MPRSVTLRVLVVTIPLISLALVGVLGSRHSTAPTTSRAVAYRANPMFLRERAHRPDLTPTVTLGELAPTPSPAAPAAPPPAISQGVAPRPAPPRPPVTSSGAASTQFALVNQDRASNSVSPLVYSAALTRVAQYRAQDMLNRNYFSHYNPSTGQLAFVELLHLWGIPYTTAGENIAWSTDPSMAGINVMFMNSPDHRANILNPAYHRLGIGVASNGVKTMVVEVFSN